MESDADAKSSAVLDELHLPPTAHKRKLSAKSADGDVALALFNTLDDLHEPVDPAAEKKLVRKIDFMILPYLAVVSGPDPLVRLFSWSHSRTVSSVMRSSISTRRP